LGAISEKNTSSKIKAMKVRKRNTNINMLIETRLRDVAPRAGCCAAGLV
jgi:hypothetical protein